MPPAITNAAIATSRVRDQSPMSCHSRQVNPKPAHARLANAPGAFLATDTGKNREFSAEVAPSSADCDSAAALDITEYVDMNPLREFHGVHTRLENRDEF
jgi:hypothetical protein